MQNLPIFKILTTNSELFLRKSEPSFWGSTQLYQKPSPRCDNVCTRTQLCMERECLPFSDHLLEDSSARQVSQTTLLIDEETNMDVTSWSLLVHQGMLPFLLAFKELHLAKSGSQQLHYLSHSQSKPHDSFHILPRNIHLKDVDYIWIKLLIHKL